MDVRVGWTQTSQSPFVPDYTLWWTIHPEMDWKPRHPSSKGSALATESNCALWHSYFCHCVLSYRLSQPLQVKNYSLLRTSWNTEGCWVAEYKTQLSYFKFLLTWKLSKLHPITLKKIWSELNNLLSTGRDRIYSKDKTPPNIGRAECTCSISCNIITLSALDEPKLLVPKRSS